MAIQGGDRRLKVHGAQLYSSLGGLEVALSLQSMMPPLEELSEQREGASSPPPSIPDRSPKRTRRISHEPGYLNLQIGRRLSSTDVIKEAQKDSIRKIAQLTGHTLDIDSSYRPKVLRLTGSNLELFNQAYLPSLRRLFGHRTSPDASEEESVHEVEWSDAASTKSSHSLYSQEVDDEIAKTITKWVSWTPSRSPSELPTKRDHFLHLAKHSPNAGGLQYSPSQRRQKPSLLSHGDQQVKGSGVDYWLTQAPRNEFNLNVIQEEEFKHPGPDKQNAHSPPPRQGEVVRKRSFRGSSRERQSQLSQIRPIRTNSALIPYSQRSSKYSVDDDLQSTTGYPDPECYHEIIRSLTPSVLQFPPRPDIDSQRCVSRFSEYSDHSAGLLSNARNSIISRIRNVPAPLKVPSKMNSMPHIAHLQRSPPSRISVDHKGQRRLSSSKYTFKTFFPFHSPLHRNSVLDCASDNNENSPNSPKKSPTKSGSLKVFFSNAVRFLSRGKESQDMTIDKDRIILNKMRRVGGPDTPIPTIPPRTSSRAGTFASKASASSASHSFLLQRSFSQRSNASSGYAVETLGDRAARGRKHKRAKSNEERRRDEIRRKIVFLGPTGESPNDVAMRWF